MKKMMIMASAFLLPVVLTGCNGKQECRRGVGAGMETEYTGTVPAADYALTAR